MCSFEDSTGLETKAGNQKRVLETGRSGFKEDGARTIGVEDEGAVKSESSISPPVPSPGFNITSVGGIRSALRSPGCKRSKGGHWEDGE
jgi:hypothetical protein